MPQDATIRGLEAGLKAEVRVAQAWYWDGYFVRRGVDLQHRFGNEVSTVTDLDILAYSLDSSLRVTKLIGEVKTGKSGSTPRPLDRAIWVRGLRDLVGAQAGEVTSSFPVSTTVRETCRQLGVTIQHMDDLAARERRLHMSLVDDSGSHGETIALVRKRVQAYVKNDPILERGYWFLVSEVWFLDPFDALKRLLGLIREISKVWPPEANKEATQALRWFFAEAISITTLNLAIIAGQANTMDERSFKELAWAKLASGDIPSYAVRKLSERFDEYMGKILMSIDAPAEVQLSAMGAFLPHPPDYTEPLIELVSRLADDAAVTASLPRQMDGVIFERLVRRRAMSPPIQRRLDLSPVTERVFRLIAAFLRGQFSIPSAVDRALTTSLAADPARTEAGGGPQAALFDTAKPETPAADE